MKAQTLIKKAKQQSNNKRSQDLSRFFKTGKGEYGEGDIFIGLMVPQIRLLAKEFKTLNLIEIKKLLQSKIHEIRLAGLLILVEQYQDDQSKKIVDFYLKNTKYINNWDLVDLSAPKILGHWFINGPDKTLEKLSNSKNLWEKRMAVLACFPRIKNKDFDLIIKLSEKFLKEKHDLMHKAVGWMLREMGKVSKKNLEQFLDRNYKQMPRTMLRYAIEKFPEKIRKNYLKK